MKPRALQARIRKALADPVLGRNVLRATDTSTAHRRETVALRPDWEDLRTRAAQLREHVVTHLDRYVGTFVEQAEARGVHVHAALDAAEARQIVLDLVKRRGCRRILKSKSMTTEEIALNPALEREGFLPLETDLGEYIVQLAGEPPSHITAPALHRSAEQIRDLFLREGVLAPDAPPPEDHDALATWLSLEARRHLRPRLLDADLGITGANFLVAETGTVVLVENEGNIRFTTTTPPIQIAIVGVEKIVPRVEDLSTLLPLLTGSATGQRATTYVSLLSGPLEELHVILLDAGRATLLARSDDREILHCIRCGACMNVCPVYRSVGGHAYGSAYPGPIGALLTPLLRAQPEDHALPYLSTLCAACTEVCPVKIDLHGHLLGLRERAVADGRRPRLEGFAFRVWRWLMGSARRYRAAVRLARLLEPAARQFGIPRGWTRFREAPRLARSSFQESWRRRGPSA